MSFYSYSRCALLGEASSTNDEGLSDHERMALVTGLGAAAMSGVANNTTLRSDTRPLLKRCALKMAQNFMKVAKSRRKYKIQLLRGAIL